jgi:hypothetical protein
MKRCHWFLLASPLVAMTPLLLTNCSGSTSGSGNRDSGTSGDTGTTGDGGRGGDTGMSGDAGTVTDTGTTTDTGTVGDGACNDPSMCPMGDVCCQMLVQGPGASGICLQVDAAAPMCKSPDMCMTNIQHLCGSTSTVRKCAASADCTIANGGMEAMYNKCCTYQFSLSLTSTFCMNAALAMSATNCM